MKKRFKISCADIVYRLWWMLKRHECHERLENIFPPRTTHGKHSWSQNQHSLCSLTAQPQGAPVTEYAFKWCPLESCNIVSHINYLKLCHFLLKYIIGKQKHSVTLPPFLQPTFSAPMNLDIRYIRFKKSNEKQSLWRRTTSWSHHIKENKEIEACIAHLCIFLFHSSSPEKLIQFFYHSWFI